MIISDMLSEMLAIKAESNRKICFLVESMYQGGANSAITYEDELRMKQIIDRTNNIVISNYPFSNAY